MKSKQPPLIEKCICVTILSVNISFLKCIYFTAYILLQINNSFCSTIALVGFLYEPVSLGVSEV